MSRDKFNSVVVSDKGFDDVGIGQATGTVTAIADAKTVSRFSGKCLLTIGSTTALKKGMPIRLAGLDSGFNGLTRILRVISATQIVVNVTYATPVDQTGTWALDGGAGAWDAFMPIGADLTAANLTLTFWDPDRQGGSPIISDYLRGQVYPFPGVIKTIQIATAGNVRLIRSSSLRPFGLTAQ